MFTTVGSDADRAVADLAMPPLPTLLRTSDIVVELPMA